VNEKPLSKWQSIGQRLGQCRDGEYIVVDPEGDPDKFARALRNRLTGIAACKLIRRSVRNVEGKIIVTRLGLLPQVAAGLSATQAGVLQGKRGAYARQSARMP
jgi:hypothetical protein